MMNKEINLLKELLSPEKETLENFFIQKIKQLFGKNYYDNDKLDEYDRYFNELIVEKKRQLSLLNLKNDIHNTNRDKMDTLTDDIVFTEDFWNNIKKKLKNSELVTDNDVKVLKSFSREDERIF